MQSSGPADVLARLNATLIARSPSPGTFLTAVCATFAREGGTWFVRLARGGHPAPILRHADGTSTFVESDGRLIGIFPDLLANETRIALAPGDALVVYTDGVNEARRGKGEPILGRGTLKNTIAASHAGSAAELARHVEDAAIAFSGGTTSDDIAILVIAIPA